MNRIEAKMKALQEKGEKAFITYITAGLPDLEGTKKLLKAQEEAGLDVVELGIPFSDPVADGPVIQDASYKAICNGINLKKVFVTVEELRKEGSELPIVFMMYYNTILHYGVEAFVKKCNEVGVDGLIIPDLPLEEQEEIAKYLNQDETTILIQLVSPVSGDRIPKILDGAKGFVYCVSSMGVTGQGSRFPQRSFKLSEEREGCRKDSGHDGIWYPHSGGCKTDERYDRRCNRGKPFHPSDGRK